LRFKIYCLPMLVQLLGLSWWNGTSHSHLQDQLPCGVRILLQMAGLLILTMILDSHFRIGGATGTHLQAKDCPKLTGSVDSKCIAASMMLHLTSTSSAYLENVWAWVADHDLDSGLAQTQINIYVARGTRSPPQIRDKSNFHRFKEFLLKAKGALLGCTEQPRNTPFFTSINFSTQRMYLWAWFVLRPVMLHSS
jgi:hypothetical protein